MIFSRLAKRSKQPRTAYFWPLPRVEKRHDTFIGVVTSRHSCPRPKNDISLGFKDLKRVDMAQPYHLLHRAQFLFRSSEPFVPLPKS